MIIFPFSFSFIPIPGNINLQLVAQAATAFTVRVPKLRGEKNQLEIHRNGKLMTARAIEQLRDYEFDVTKGDGIYPNCKYDVTVRNCDNNGAVVANAGCRPSLSFRTQGNNFTVISLFGRFVMAKICYSERVRGWGWGWG